VDENIITINTKHLGTKITVLCVNLENVQFYEKLNETLASIGTTREIIIWGILIVIQVQK